MPVRAYNSPVAYLDWVGETLAARLAQDSIGEPVAMRAFLQLSADHGLLIPTLATALAGAVRWFGPLSSVYAQGGATAGHVSVLAEYGGRTALVSTELLRSGEAGSEQPNIRYLVIGNHGTVQFSDAPGEDGLRVDVSPNADRATNAAAALIEESLRQGRPVRRG